MQTASPSTRTVLHFTEAIHIPVSHLRRKMLTLNSRKEFAQEYVNIYLLGCRCNLQQPFRSLKAKHINTSVVTAMRQFSYIKGT